MEHVISQLVHEFERGKVTRRELIQGLGAIVGSSLAASPAAAAQSGGRIFPATAFNHVSLQVADYSKARDFYAGIFGMKVQFDNGGECELAFGNNLLIVRNRDRGMVQSPAQSLGQASATPKVDHIAYTVAGWDTDKSVKPALKAELERRGLRVREVTRVHAPITKGAGDSFIVSDPDQFPVQMGGEEQ